MIKAGRALEELVKKTFFPGLVFEELGLRYIGPVQGHSLPSLDRGLREGQDLRRARSSSSASPRRARGYAAGPGRTPRNSTAPRRSDRRRASRAAANGGPSYSERLRRRHDQDRREGRRRSWPSPRPCARGRASRSSPRSFPDRFFDVGIAEQHAVTFAAGLAVSRLQARRAPSTRPSSSGPTTRSTTTSACRTCRSSSPSTGPGIVPDDGPTHQGVNDIAYLRHMPNMIVMAPATRTSSSTCSGRRSRYGHPARRPLPQGQGPGRPDGRGSPGPSRSGRSELRQGRPGPPLRLRQHGQSGPRGGRGSGEGRDLARRRQRPLRQAARRGDDPALRPAGRTVVTARGGRRRRRRRERRARAPRPGRPLRHPVPGDRPADRASIRWASPTRSGPWSASTSPASSGRSGTSTRTPSAPRRR